MSIFSKNPLAGLFGRSPFKPVQEHMKVVEECAADVVPLFEALEQGDEEKVVEIKNRIFELEEQADDIKNEIRDHLPKSLFMPVDRRDLLDLLNHQDSIADTAQDVAGLVTLVKLEIPEPLKQLLMLFVKRNVEAAQQCAKIMDMLDELVETGFRGREAELVEELLKGLSRIEDDSDDQGMALTKLLIDNDENMRPSTFFIWYELLQRLGDIADYAQDVGDRLRLLIAR